MGLGILLWLEFLECDFGGLFLGNHGGTEFLEFQKGVILPNYSPPKSLLSPVPRLATNPSVFSHKPNASSRIMRLTPGLYRDDEGKRSRACHKCHRERKLRHVQVCPVKLNPEWKCPGPSECGRVDLHPEVRRRELRKIQVNFPKKQHRILLPVLGLKIVSARPSVASPVLPEIVILSSFYERTTMGLLLTAQLWGQRSCLDT